jgi:hypothetical protein
MESTERSPNLTINRLPDEVLLEVFVSYRQSIDQNDNHWRWRKKYVWLNLAHVCRRWRAVMFASSSRLDLIITVGPQKPGHIKTILSSPLPIFIEYQSFHEDITGSALWRMRAALRHRDRVREISFRGSDVSFGKFIRATNYHFPALESLHLGFPCDRELDIPPTFLRAPDQSDLRLRCLRHLRLSGVSLASVSGLLLSATALTELTLDMSSNPAVLDPSQRLLLLACLQGMQSLRRLALTTPDDIDPPSRARVSQSQHSTPKDIVILLELTRFYYSGSTIFLNNLMSGLSAPSLQYACFLLCSIFPHLDLSRVIDDVSEEFRSLVAFFDISCFGLLSSNHSVKIDHFEPSFSVTVHCSPNSTKSMLINSTPSTKLAKVEELTLFFLHSNTTKWEHDFSLRQFRSVRLLRVRANAFLREVGLYLQQYDGEGILPVLEEIELLISPLTRHSDEESPYQRRHDATEALAAFEPFVSARERAGRIVKIHHRDL